MKMWLNFDAFRLQRGTTLFPVESHVTDTLLFAQKSCAIINSIRAQILIVSYFPKTSKRFCNLLERATFYG